MLIEPEVLRALCRATQDFVNLRKIASTDQVKEIFDTAVAKVSRVVTLPNGDTISPRLQWGEDISVTDFERDREGILAYLIRIADHGEAQKDRNASTKNKGAEAQELRAELSETLQRLIVSTAVDFNEKAGTLRLFPLVFGVEAACYLTAAAMLEPRTSAYVRRCELVACNNLVLHPGGRSRSTIWCSEHTDQGPRTKSWQRRTPRRRRTKK